MTQFNQFALLVELIALIMLCVATIVPLAYTVIPLYLASGRMPWANLSRIGFKLVIAGFVTRAMYVRYSLLPEVEHTGSTWGVWLSLVAMLLIITTWISHPDHFKGT